jgi:hypothetical protein
MNEQLLAYLFDDKPHILAESMDGWIDSSRRFKDFATEYRDKIRKKIRITQGDSAINDLAVELAVAYQLIQQKRFTVAYEPYGSQKRRGPDFAVTFKSLIFNVEVTRIDSSNMKRKETPPTYDPQQVNGRLMDTVCDKLGQMRPEMINLLLIATSSDFFAALDLEQALAQLKDRAERKEESLFSRYRFSNTADFFKHYLRLSGLLVHPISQVQSTLWLNNQAKHALPRPIQNILKRELFKT